MSTSDEVRQTVQRAIDSWDKELNPGEIVTDWTLCMGTGSAEGGGRTLYIAGQAMPGWKLRGMLEDIIYYFDNDNE